MDEQLKQSALAYHQNPKPGKISVTPTKPLSNQLDLSLAYSPGVAAACMAIYDEPLDAQKYTSRGNLVGVSRTARPCWASATSARSRRSR